MGIASEQALHLLYLRQKYRDKMTGRILQLGRQDTYFDFPTFKARAQSIGTNLIDVPITTVKNPWIDQSVIDDQTLFSALGFQRVESLDFVPNEKPSLVHDLNEQVPSSLHERWDVIYDGGTFEHVFDLATAFSNIHKMLKPGGLIIHESPTNNFVDHGFWQINPTALLDRYLANDYQMLEALVYVFDFGCDFHIAVPQRFIYDPAAFSAVSIGHFPKGLAGTFIAVQKPDDATKPFVKPVQGMYRRYWNLDQGQARPQYVGMEGGPLGLQPISKRREKSSSADNNGEAKSLVRGRKQRLRKLLSLFGAGT